MKTWFVTRAKKLLVLITVSCVIGLNCISLFPWLSVPEETDSGEVNVTYSWNMMEQGNKQVQEIGKEIGLLATIIWVTIIFCLAAFVGIAVLESERYTILGQFIMMGGCATLIFSSIAIMLKCHLIIQINSAPTLSLSVIVTQLPLRYIDVAIIIGCLSLIGSLFYTISFIKYWLHRLTSSLKQLQKTMTMKEKTKVRQGFFRKKQKTKKAEARDPTIPYSGTPIDHIDIRTHEQPPKDIPVTNKKTKEEPEKNDKEELSAPIKEQAPSKKEPKTSPFDKKSGGKPVKRTVSVRCPQCSEIFSVEKEQGPRKIQCPHCGKTGVMK